MKVLQRLSNKTESTTYSIKIQKKKKLDLNKTKQGSIRHLYLPEALHNQQGTEFQVTGSKARDVELLYSPSRVSRTPCNTLLYMLFVSGTPNQVAIMGTAQHYELQ